MPDPQITPEAREAALFQAAKALVEIGRKELPATTDAAVVLSALIALGWGPTADADAEILRLKNDVKELRDIRDLFVGWPTPIHMQDAMMEMRKRTWREAHAQGWREGREAAAKILDEERGAFRCAGIKDVADVLDFAAARIRAIPDPEQNEGRGNG